MSVEVPEVALSNCPGIELCALSLHVACQVTALFKWLLKVLDGIKELKAMWPCVVLERNQGGLPGSTDLIQSG